MTDVFISFKHEDEARVIRLVRALEASGLSVWWDRGLNGAGNWRDQIEAAHAAAKCVIVVWSKASVGPGGDFVLDEAGRALKEKRLVAVMFDKVRIPLGFGELQAIDLIGWRGSVKNPFFLDLVAVLRAKISGAPAPKAKGPTALLLRNLLIGGGISGVVAALSYGVTALGVAPKICKSPLTPIQIEDLCGAMRIEGVPDAEDRLAWEKARRGGRCQDLRDYINQTGRRVYRAEADARLNARQIKTIDSWTRQTRPLPLLAPATGPASPTDAAARSSALKRGQTLADATCKAMATTTLFKFERARFEVKPSDWTCQRDGGGVVCGFSAEVSCDLIERRQTEEETCQTKP